MEPTERLGAPPGEPFESRPLDPVETAGCGKPVLIGCGVVLLLAAVAFLVLLLNADKLLAWSLETSRTEILANLPSDLEPAERDRLDAAFTALLRALEEGRADAPGLAQLQRPMLRTAGKIGRLERADVLELTRALERAAGVAPPEAAPEPAPALPESAAVEPVAA